MFFGGAGGRKSGGPSKLRVNEPPHSKLGKGAQIVRAWRRSAQGARSPRRAAATEAKAVSGERREASWREILRECGGLRFG